VSNPYYKQHWIDIEPERHAAYDQILGYHPSLEAIIRPLELRPGLRVLDVGSGPAYTTMELARRVAPSGQVTGGKVVGIDINAEFIARASVRAREAKLPIEFTHSGFPPLPFPDAGFDRVFCKNVLEYVDSAADTVKEMARVAAPGAIVVASDSDWDLLVLETGEADRERHERVLAAAKSIAVHEPRIGRMLYGLFRNAGLADVKVEILAGADTVGRALPMLKASWSRYARDSGRVSDAEVTAWLNSVDSAIETGRFLFLLPQFVVCGVKK